MLRMIHLRYSRTSEKSNERDRQRIRTMRQCFRISRWSPVGWASSVRRRWHGELLLTPHYNTVYLLDNVTDAVINCHTVLYSVVVLCIARAKSLMPSCIAQPTLSHRCNCFLFCLPNHNNWPNPSWSKSRPLSVSCAPCGIPRVYSC